jgi:hypothetical protein
VQRTRRQKPPPYLRCVAEPGLELLAFILAVSRMSVLSLGVRPGKPVTMRSAWPSALTALQSRPMLWLSPTKTNQALNQGVIDGSWAALVQGRNLVHPGEGEATVGDVTVWAQDQAEPDDRVQLVQCMGMVSFDPEMWSRREHGAPPLIAILEPSSKRAFIRTRWGVKLLVFRADFRFRAGDLTGTVRTFVKPWLIMGNTDTGLPQPCCELPSSIATEAAWCVRCAAAVLCQKGRHLWNEQPACKQCCALAGSPSKVCAHCRNGLSGPNNTCAACGATAHLTCTDTWTLRAGLLYCPDATCVPWSGAVVSAAQARCTTTNCGEVDWTAESTLLCLSCARLTCSKHSHEMSQAGTCHLCTRPDARTQPKSPHTPNAGPGPRKGFQRAGHNA